VESIKNLNWTSLALNFLIASIREYRVAKAENLKGNLVLLQVCQQIHTDHNRIVYLNPARATRREKIPRIL
jgi:hypothetical protein